MARGVHTHQMKMVRSEPGSDSEVAFYGGTTRYITRLTTNPFTQEEINYE